MIVIKLFRRILSVTAGICVIGCASFSTPVNAAVTVSDSVFKYQYSGGSWQLYQYIGDSTTVTLPQTYGGTAVTTICEGCFSDSGVVEVTIPEGYTTIESFSFSGCQSLKSVDFADSVSYIGMGAFSGCQIESADLSRLNIDAIRNYTFKSCTSLKSVKLPESVTYIGEYAFYETALENAEIPGKVTSLGDYAFADTASLETVTLSNGLKTIGSSCFENSALSSINLPEGLEKIGASAFRNASSLASLYIPGSVEEIGAYALYPMSVQSTLHIDCFRDSYADNYCYENFIMDYTAFDKLYGDADLNGVINISDATDIQRHCAYLKQLSPQQKVLADVNRDGFINVIDATTVQRILLHAQN